MPPWSKILPQTMQDGYRNSQVKKEHDPCKSVTCSFWRTVWLMNTSSLGRANNKPLKLYWVSSNGFWATPYRYAVIFFLSLNPSLIPSCKLTFLSHLPILVADVEVWLPQSGTRSHNNCWDSRCDLCRGKWGPKFDQIICGSGGKKCLRIKCCDIILMKWWQF